MRLLVAIPTYNRPEIIEEFCEKYLLAYFNAGIDIYIYDSSENDYTAGIIEKYGKQYDNLSYFRINSDISSNKKIYMIFQRYMWKKDFDYIWLCGDSLRYTEKAFKKVWPYLTEGFDLIVTDIMNCEHLGIRNYEDAQVLFDDCAWYMTMYGGVILKTSSMLKNVSWDELERKYLSFDTQYYSQIGLYFEQILKIKEFKAIHIELDETEGFQSSLKKNNGWYEKRVDILCYNWINTIYALPDYYQNKDVTIQKLGRFSDAFSNRSIYLLKRDKIYNYSKFKQYRDKWGLVTDTSITWLFLVAVLPTPICTVLFNILLTVKGVFRKMKIIK